MKKIIYALLIMLPLWGCKDFLDEVDQDRLVPEKTDHYAALLLKEFNAQYPIFKSIDYMTDNMVEDNTALTSDKISKKTTFTWQREIEIDEEGNFVSGINDSWVKMYEDIAIANYVIELIDEATGEPEERMFIEGEALFVRALSYFNLLNLYGQPYNPSTANVDLGVPLRDDIGVESHYSRNTVKECYEFIEKELVKAQELIADSKLEKSIWHPRASACDLLMSRVKLYQRDWDQAIEFANKVIKNHSLSSLSATSPFVTRDNREILYSYNNKALMPVRQVFEDTGNLGDDIKAFYWVNPELIALYADNDRRRECFFKAIDDGSGKVYYRTTKYQKYLYTEVGYTNLRVAEAYLNRAEAYAKKGEVSKAIADIKALHATRYNNASSVVYPTEPEEVLSYVLDERRRELCFEDHHRWFDLRRMEKRPEIKHVFTLIEDDGNKIGTEVYTLLSNDLNYTLSIPIDERNNNPLIRNNERYEKVPVIDEEIIIP